jgi:hypothetical protein
LADALRATAQRILATDPSARLACVHVLKIARLAIDPWEDEQGRNRHLQRMIELKHWARSLTIDPARVTYHVLEATDPGGRWSIMRATTMSTIWCWARVEHRLFGAISAARHRTSLRKRRARSRSCA